MKNTFISALLFVSIQFSFGQDGGSFTPDPQFVNVLAQGRFKLPLTSGDPLEQIKALDQFSSERKRIHPRGGLVFRLDSTIQRSQDFEGETKIIRQYQYGEKDKTSTNTMTILFPGADSAIIITEEFLYNNLNLVSQYDLSYLGNRTRHYFNYNTEGLLESATEYSSFGTPLEPADSATYRYNTQALPVSVTHYDWDENSASWLERYKEEYTYTPFKKLLSYVTSARETVGSPWVFLSKKDYTNAQGLLRTIISSSWNDTTWEKSYRTDFTYDDNDQLLLEQSDQIWIPEDSQWQDEYLFLYEYNAEGKRISARDRRWFQDGHVWIIGDSLSYEYNLLGDTSTIWSYRWGQASNPWEWQGWGKYYYNTGIPFSDIVLRPQSFIHTLPETFHSMLTGSLLLGLGDYDLPDSVEYYYSVISATATDPSPELIAVYPNPSSNQITIQMIELSPGATITFFDQQGKFAATRPLQSNEPVSISGLVPGAYVYRIRNGAEFYSGKMLKE